MHTEEKHAVVVVMGDIGQSPRMQFHAYSLAELGCRVSLIGQMDSEPYAQVSNHPKIECQCIKDTDVTEGKSSLFSSLFRLSGQSMRLMNQLTALPSYQYVLMQNPPAIPAMFVTWLIARLRAIISGKPIELIIDWHNLGFTRLAGKYGKGHWAVALYRFLESFLPVLCDRHFTVSQALKARLKREFQLGPVSVIHDCPPTWLNNLSLKPLSKAAARERLKASGLQIPETCHLIISPTSWTEDEDFALLLKAVELFEKRLKVPEDKKLCFLITGKGPGRSAFEEKVKALDLSHVVFLTAWLEAELYPVALKAADYGLCLHTSSSGVDIPMKLSDMLGAQLPAFTFDYDSCLRESFEADVHGYFFKTSDELVDLFCQLLIGNEELILAVESDAIGSWEAEWKLAVSPYFRLF